MNRVILVVLSAIGLSGSASIALADDRLDELVAQCGDCHGADGVSAHEDVPTIAGQSAAFLAKALRTYRERGRPCIKSSYRAGDTERPKTDMCKVAGGLSDEDMQALGEHYAAQPFRAAPQPFDAALAETGAALHQKHCDACHGDGAAHANRGPRLAGQWVTYLRTSLRFVPTGEHLVPPAMENTLVELDPQEIDALMHYYASQQGEQPTGQQE
jgi:cytochrome subunit of sulfide dehydrogenase